MSERWGSKFRCPISTKLAKVPYLRYPKKDSIQNEIPRIDGRYPKHFFESLIRVAIF